MMIARVRLLIAASLAATLLGACGGGGSTAHPISVGTAPANTVTAAVRIVGVGDSLTAGYQSDGLLGVPTANPVTGSPFGPYVPPTQENGYWALLWSQANGGAATGTVSGSPLPLILGPGLGTVLVPNALLAPTPITTACGAFNSLGFSYTTALQTRANPTTTPYDLGIPGQNVHEAFYQTGPESPCSVPATAPLSGIVSLVSGESGVYYPIMGNFPTGITQTQAAASLHTQYATVWLGSNDLLKYTFSLGLLPATQASAMQADLVKIIQTLQAAGEKVLIANLVTVLDAALFTPQPALVPTLTAEVTAGATAACANATPAQYATLCGGATPAYAAQVGAAAGAQVTAAGPTILAALQSSYGVGPGGYVTLSGIAKILGAFEAHSLTAIAPGGADALGGGDFVPDALASQVSALNISYNTAIAAAAKQTGAALVDINTPFTALAANPGSVVPGHCCTLQYGGGFFSLDGLHPSNTGYAVIANLFIAQMNASYGTSIPLVNVAQVYATDPFAPH
jgi:lysophospholipase L1-like esterase